MVNVPDNSRQTLFDEKLNLIDKKQAPNVFSNQDDLHNRDSETSGTGGLLTADGIIRLFYANRAYEHQDTISLMQRYFAWSIYALIVLWLAITMTCIFIASIKPIPQCLFWAFIFGSIGAFIGIGFGLVRSLHKETKSADGEKAKTENRERFFKDLLNCVVFYSFLLGMTGMVAGASLRQWCAFPGQGFSFDIEEPVLITLISTTTISILGIFACVMKWLFPHISSEKNKP